uniref:phospholipase D family protein n=1 Tax=Burkholderia anthina TaxID=179879 RepID=UPI00158B67A7|nr:phospholipase D family protein [Burkholderia anthina]
MLKLDSERLDYGNQLRPPPGYRLDLAIATTYSLDLEALAAASLALTLDQTLEGDLSGERLALLESIDQLQTRLLVFYQRGNIKVPNKFNRLFAMLEPLLVPSVALEGSQGAWASFHPKVWLLRFVPENEREPVRLRFLVLSRNLTFDRSWDIAVSLDGSVVKRRGNSDPGLTTFLRSLIQTKAHARHIEDMCQTLEAVDWELPTHFEELSVLPGFRGNDSVAGSAPIDLDGSIDELLVVSPFVDAGDKSLLQDLASRTRGTRTLISRGDTLDKIGEPSLAAWDTLSLSELVVDGEERLEVEAPAAQDLHAKLIVAKKGSGAIWHVGSANMTDAAFGRPSQGVLPRNQELMLKLVGRNARIGPSALLAEWTPAKVFQTHIFRNGVSTAQESGATMRKVIYGLTSATWRIHADEIAEDQFSVELSVAPLGTLPPGYSVTVGLLCRQSPKPLAPTVTWENVNLTDASAFVPVEVTSEVDGGSQRFAIQASFSVDLLDRRKRAIFKETVGSGEKLLRYLTLLLDTNATKGRWLGADGDGGSVDIFGLDGKGALCEQLLRAASRAPERMNRAISVFERIRAEEVELPAGLDALFGGFTAFSGEHQ